MDAKAEHDRCAAALDDLVDGRLARDVADEVEAHCAACAECGRELTGLRALRAATAALPRSEEPPPAVWAAVAARTVARPASPASWFAYASAAAVVGALGGLLAVQLAPPAPPVAAVVTAPHGAAVRAVADPGMERRVHLVSEVTRDGKRIAPDALAAVERNMAVIQSALAEIEAAVQANPNDANLRRLLTEIHIRESALIERMQRLNIENNRRNDI